jgi:hypothetical protein
MVVAQPAAPTFREYMQQQITERRAVASPPVPSYPYPYPYPTQQPPVGHAYQYPAPTYQLQYMVPAYLSIPEQRLIGESVWGHLAREGVRSIFKALGHTIANYFDTHPFRIHQPPPPPGGPEQK